MLLEWSRHDETAAIRSSMLIVTYQVVTSRLSTLVKFVTRYLEGC